MATHAIRLLTIIGFCCAVTPPANAQNRPLLTELSLEALGQLEVFSASKTPETIWRTGAAISVLSQDDIRRSGATSLPELLRLVPGVQVSRIDSDHWAVGIRGFGDSFSKSLLVMIDGRSIYTPLFAGVYWGVHDVLLGDIDRIEVIRGPGGTIWGANAVNGVINIITKRSSETRGIHSSIGVGSTDRGIADFRFGDGNGRGFDYRVSAKAFKRDPEFHPDGASWDTWWLGQAGFRADWERPNGATFTVQGDVYRGSNGQRVQVTTISPPAPVRLDDPLKVSGGNLLARWQRAMSGRGRIRIQGYYDRTGLDGPHFAEVRDTLDVDLIHDFAMGRHTLTWGTGARWSPGRFRQVVPTLDFVPRHQTATLLSVFGQDEIEIVPNRVRTTLGAKIERNHYTGTEIQPTARVQWTPGLQQTIWASATKAVRTPSRIEADIKLTSFLLATPLVFSEVVGNPDLNAERQIAYEVGYRTLVASRFYLDFAGFHDRYDDLLSNRLVTVLPPPYIILRFPYANGIRGSANGGEVAMDWNPTARWRLSGSYARVLIDLENKPGDIDVNAVNRYEGSTPRQQATARSSLNLPGGFEFDQIYRYAGALSSRGISAYHTGDMRLAWRASPALELSITGRDLFEPRHLEFPHSPGPNVSIRRSIYASATWSRGQSSAP